METYGSYHYGPYGGYGVKSMNQTQMTAYLYDVARDFYSGGVSAEEKADLLSMQVFYLIDENRDRLVEESELSKFIYQLSLPLY